MKTAYVVTNGSGFDSGVVPAGPLRPAGSTERREPQDGYFEALSSLVFDPGITPEEKQQANRLIAERIGMNDRVNKLLDAYRARVRVLVAKEHEESKRLVRQQQDKLAKHHEAISEMQSELNRANEKKSLAYAARDAALEEQRRLSRYATKAQHAKAAELLAQREAACDVAAREAGTIQSQINFATLTGLKPLQEALNELMAEEARLNHHVSGAGYTTALGLVVPARPPL
jgi:phage protein D